VTGVQTCALPISRSSILKAGNPRRATKFVGFDFGDLMTFTFGKVTRSLAGLKYIYDNISAEIYISTPELTLLSHQVVVGAIP
jgi:hypothetical protein